MGYYRESQAGVRSKRTSPKISKQTAIRIVSVVGVFLIAASAFSLGSCRKEKEIENSGIVYEPLTVIGGGSDGCEDGQCGIRERGRSIIKRLLGR